jgi:hypothetical protein
MKTITACATAILMLGSSGCAWPAATSIRGLAEVTRPGLHPATGSPASQSAEPARVVLVKYWRVQELFNSERMKFEFFGAGVYDKASFPVSFPLRFYPAIWTPALGTQHVLPDAGLVVFADGRWPCHVIAGDGRRCCEAPSTGERHWHVKLQPMDQAPASLPPNKGWDGQEFPPLTPEELESVLKWSGSVTMADRAMCRRQLERLLEYWRSKPRERG